MKRWETVVVALLVALFAAVAAPPPLGARAAADRDASSWSEAIPTGRPEDVGLSSERLARIAPVMQRYVEEGRVAGAVGAIARRGRLVYLESWCIRDREASAAMEDDAIFRIFSMKKGITGGAHDAARGAGTPAVHAGVAVAARAGEDGRRGRGGRPRDG